MLEQRILEQFRKPVSGARKLRVIYNYYKTSARKGATNSLQDLQSVKLANDNLERFLPVWEDTVHGLDETQPEHNLQDLLYAQLKQSKRMTIDIQMYERDEPNGPSYSYDALLARLRYVVNRAREDKARQQKVDGIKRSSGGGGGGTGAAAGEGKPKKKPKGKAKAKSAAGGSRRSH